MKRLLILAAFLAVPALAVAEDDADAVKRAFGHANHQMMMDMDIAATGDADKDFVRMMIPHHQGAIDMAKVEIQYGKDEKLKAMAREIIAAQEKEIAEMKDWLAKNP